MRISLPLCTLAVLAFALVPSGLSAQWCGTYNPYCGGTGKHFVVMHTEGGLENPHPDCVYESEEPWGHPPCWPSDVDREAYSSALELATNGDIEGLVSIRGVLASYLTVNEERGTLQLLNCSKTYVVANLPIDDALVVALLEEQDQ